MPNSSASASVLLPFGSLMGAIPVDSLQRERVLGDFESILSGSGRRPSEIQQQIHSAILPGSAHTELSPSLKPRRDGGI